MKILVLTSALLVSLSASAALTTYDCGNAYGKPVSLTVSTAKEGSLFDFKATFIAPSRDLITRTLIRSEKFSLAGDVETHDGSKYYVLTSTRDALHKVLVKVGKKLGQKVTLTDLNTSVGIDATYECMVVKLRK